MTGMNTTSCPQVFPRYISSLLGDGSKTGAMGGEKTRGIPDPEKPGRPSSNMNLEPTMSKALAWGADGGHTHLYMYPGVPKHTHMHAHVFTSQTCPAHFSRGLKERGMRLRRHTGPGTWLCS